MQRVAPAVARSRPRVDPVARRIELDRLAGDLLDQRPLREVIFQRLACRQQAVAKLQETQLEQRVLIVPPDGAHTVFGADVAKEEEQDQGIGLVTVQLQKAGRANLLALGREQVPEVLRPEEVAGEARRHPDRLAAPLARGCQRLDLFQEALQARFRDAVQAMMDDPCHALSLPPRLPAFEDLLLPWLGLDLDRQASVSGGEQELATSRHLQSLALHIAELERALQLLSLPWALGAEKANRGVGRHHQARLAAEQVPGILRRKDQRAIVFPDSACEPDHEAAHGRVFEEQTQLVNHQQAPPAALPKSAPEGLGEEEMDRSDHLLAQLAHAEDDHRQIEVDVCRSAEHRAEAAMGPAAENAAGARGSREPSGYVTQHRLRQLAIGESDGCFQQRFLGLVETTTDRLHQIHRRSEERRVGKECRSRWSP